MNEITKRAFAAEQMLENPNRYLKGILGATDHPLLGRDELECILALAMLPEAEDHGA